jgi:hypothetical protein
MLVPAPHVVPHLLAEQYSSAGHAASHAPQFCESIFVSVQTVPHFVAPPAQSSAH